MALTVTDRGLTQTTPGVSATNSVTTGSFSPAGGALLIVCAFCELNQAGVAFTSVADTFTGTGTWTERATAHSSTIYDLRYSVWTAQLGSAPGSGTLTVTRSAGTVDQWLWIDTFEVSGHNTVTPIGGTGSQTTASCGATNSLTLSTVPASTSLVIGGYAQDNPQVPAVSEPAGWIEAQDTVAAGSWGSEAESAYLNSGGIQTFTWGSTDTLRIAAWAAIEVVADVQAPTIGDWRRLLAPPARPGLHRTLRRAAEKLSTPTPIYGPAAAADVNVAVTATTDVTFVANQATASEGVNGGNAAVTFTANNPTASIKPSAGSAAVTFTANNPSLDTRPNAGVAPVAFTANQATVSVKVNAGVAPVTFTANNPSLDVRPGAGVAAVTFTANQPTAADAVNAGSAPVVFTAYDATVSTASITNAPAGLASVVFTANNPTVDERPNAGAAAVTFTANNPSLNIKPSAGVAAVAFTANQPTADERPNVANALVVFTANQPTVTTTTNVNAPAGNAAVTFVANQPSTSVKVNAGVATITFTANQPQAVPAISPAAGVASVTIAAQQANISAAVTAITALVVFTANDATVPSATQPAPQLNPAALYYRPAPAVYTRFGIVKLYRPAVAETAGSSLATHYLDASVGRAFMADPGVLPQPCVFVAKVLGPVTAGGVTNHTIVAQYDADPQRAWLLRRTEVTGAIVVTFTPTGNAAGATSRSVVGAAPTQGDEWIAISIQQTGSTILTAYRSNDGVTYTQTGTRTDAAVIPFDSNGSVRIGAYTAAQEIFDGRIYSVELRTGTNPTAGTVQWRFNADDYPGTGTSYVDPRGQTWTLTTATAIKTQTVPLNPPAVYYRPGAR